MRGAPTGAADSTATGPWPRFYQVTTISDGRPGGAAHADRRITHKARGRLKNGSGRAGEHPTPILAVEKPGSGAQTPSKPWLQQARQAGLREAAANVARLSR